MTEQKWNMEQILWDLIPNTIKIGIRSFTPETIRSITAEDLRSFVKVFTGRPFCSAPTITADQATITPGGGSIPAGAYIYKFTALTEYDEGAQTGESLPCSYILLDIPTALNSIEWQIEDFISDRAYGFRIYRSEAIVTLPGESPVYYEQIPMFLRYEIDDLPETFTDDGSDPDYSETGPPSFPSSYYDPDTLDPSNTLDEIRNKILQIAELVNLSTAPEKYLPYFFYFLRSLFDASLDTDAQIDEFKKRLDVIKIRTTIPSIMRIIRNKRRELGRLVGSGLDEVYEPFNHIAKYSHAVLSGVERFPSPGTKTFSATGKLYAANPTILVETDVGNPIFNGAQEGYFILMPDEGGSRKGFKIAVVIDDFHVEIPQASVLWNDPRHIGATEISVEYFLFTPYPESHHITSWDYWHHGVYEVRTTLNPLFIRDEILDNVHPAGTRLYFQYLLTTFLCEDLEDLDSIDWSSWMLQISTVTRGVTDTDEITDPYLPHIRNALHINVGGTWKLDKKNGEWTDDSFTFQGGTDYPLNGDWEFIKDETNFPEIKYYIKWTGSSPSVGTEYQVLHIDCKAYFGEIRGSELGIFIEPELRNTLCGLVLSVGPALSMSGATLSGCISELEEIGLYIDIGYEWPLPALMRRQPTWSATLFYHDLSGIIGYLCGMESPNPFGVCWVTDSYRHDDEPPYLDAQGPDDVGLLIRTDGASLDNPSLTRDGTPDTADEFTPHQTKLVTEVVEVNQGGTWNETTETFDLGTTYTEGDDYLFVIDDTVFPHRYYIDWSPGGIEPAGTTDYNIAYRLEG